MIDKRKSDPSELGGKRGYVSVEIEKETYQHIAKTAEKQNISIRRLVNDITRQRFERDEFVRRVVPKFKLIDISEDSILIRDDKAKTTRLANIELRDGRLWCDLDTNYDCEHIRYVLIHPKFHDVKDKIKQI